MIALHAPQLVFIASPWQLHVTHALYCIQHGCHVALEIKGGLYLHEYQPLIEAAEAGKKKIFPLENTLFRQEILAMHNLVSAGELGEVVYMRGGYRHDLRNLLLDDQGNLGNRKRRKASGEANSTSRKMATFILPTDWLLSASSPVFPAKTVLYA